MNGEASTPGVDAINPGADAIRTSALEPLSSVEEEGEKEQQDEMEEGEGKEGEEGNDSTVQLSRDSTLPSLVESISCRNVSDALFEGGPSQVSVSAPEFGTSKPKIQRRFMGPLGGAFSGLFQRTGRGGGGGRSLPHSWGRQGTGISMNGGKNNSEMKGDGGSHPPIQHVESAPAGITSVLTGGTHHQTPKETNSVSSPPPSMLPVDRNKTTNTTSNSKFVPETAETFFQRQAASLGMHLPPRHTKGAPNEKKKWGSSEKKGGDSIDREQLPLAQRVEDAVFLQAAILYSSEIFSWVGMMGSGVGTEGTPKTPLPPTKVEEGSAVTEWGSGRSAGPSKAVEANPDVVDDSWELFPEDGASDALLLAFLRDQLSEFQSAHSAAQLHLAIGALQSRMQKEGGRVAVLERQFREHSQQALDLAGDTPYPRWRGSTASTGASPSSLTPAPPHAARPHPAPAVSGFTGMLGDDEHLEQLKRRWVQCLQSAMREYQEEQEDEGEGEREGEGGGEGEGPSVPWKIEFREEIRGGEEERKTKKEAKKNDGATATFGLKNINIADIPVSPPGTMGGGKGKGAKLQGSMDTNEGYVSFPILFACCRERVASARSVHRMYGLGRGEMSYGLVWVSIPDKMGHLATPELQDASATWRHHRVREGTPRNSVTVLAASSLEEEKWILAAKSLAEHSNDGRVVVQTHGFSTDLTMAVRRLALLTYTVNFRGVPILFSWPSGEQTAKGGPISQYSQAEDNCAWAAPDLATLLRTVKLELCPSRLNLLAHSMGCRLVLNAMHKALPLPSQSQLKKTGIPRSTNDGFCNRCTATHNPSDCSATHPEDPPPFDSLVLAAPDVDTEEFFKSLPHLSRVCSSVTVYCSHDDQPLILSKTLHKGLFRLGDAKGLATLLGGRGEDGGHAGPVARLKHVREMCRRGQEGGHPKFGAHCSGASSQGGAHGAGASTGGTHTSGISGAETSQEGAQGGPAHGGTRSGGAQSGAHSNGTPCQRHPGCCHCVPQGVENGAKEGCVPIPPLTIVDTTGEDYSLMNHSYVFKASSIVLDCSLALIEGLPPSQRPWLFPASFPSGFPYWTFREQRPFQRNRIPLVQNMVSVLTKKNAGAQKHSHIGNNNKQQPLRRRAAPTPGQKGPPESEPEASTTSTVGDLLSDPPLAIVNLPQTLSEMQEGVGVSKGVEVLSPSRPSDLDPVSPSQPLLSSQPRVISKIWEDEAPFRWNSEDVIVKGTSVKLSKERMEEEMMS